MTLAVALAGLVWLGCTRSDNPRAPTTNMEAKQDPMSTPSPGAGDKVVLSEEEWRKRLTLEQYRVCRRHGTEPAWSGKYHDSKKEGTYVCVACGNELFSSRSKFDSGTGWPSFYEPIAPGKVGEQTDKSFFMTRIEVHCDRCGCHLGHVFDDGPRPTGLRYCINSVSLDFKEAEPRRE